MSSDQQLCVVPVPAVSDLCQNKPKLNDEQCDENGTLVNTVIAANVILENETVASTGPSQCDEENSKVNLPMVDKNISFHCPIERESGVGENGNNSQWIAEIDKNVECEVNGEVAKGHSNGGSDAVSCPNGNNSTEPNNQEAINSVGEDQFHTVGSRTENEAAPQTINLEHSENPASDTFDEDTPPCPLPESEDSKATEDPPNVPSEIDNEMAESATVNDDDEIDHSDDASIGDNDNSSNEHDSNEEFPDILDFDNGTNEVDNEEFILDTVVRKPRKERRRIVSVNDDDSDREMEVERELLMRSPSAIEDNRSAERVNEEEDEDIERLIRNEKPGPKSKKVSTQKLKELQARELLRNAVVIPSSIKKKKNRILDSDDDDDNSLLPYCVDVDDIGLPDTEYHDNENDDADTLVTSSILLNDIDRRDSSSMENLNRTCSPGVSNVNETAIKTEPQDDRTAHEFPSPGDSQCSSEILQEIRKQSPKAEPVSVKEEVVDVRENQSPEAFDSENGANGKENETADFPPFSSGSSSEDEEEFVPNDVYFGTPDRNSKRSARGKAHSRGRPAQSSARESKTWSNDLVSIREGRGGASRRVPRRTKFSDNRRTSSTSESASTSSSSDSEDQYQKSKARRKPETFTIVKQPMQLYRKVSLPSRPVQRQPQLQPHQPQQQRPNQRKRDRFYDKSQDIPNSIYFDVDVPLHVLHSYCDSDSDNDATNNRNSKASSASKTAQQIRFSSQVARGRGRTIATPNPLGQLRSDSRHQLPDGQQRNRGRPKVSSVSPSHDRSIQMMKKYLKAAGLKKVKLNRLWEGCKSNSERADKMLELLREKGLEGEPTIAKCKQLKVEFLTKKEIEDLDPNLIIQTEGRTTRRSTRAAAKRQSFGQYTYDEEEILETRTKLRKVIDSDSDFE